MWNWKGFYRISKKSYNRWKKYNKLIKMFNDFEEESNNEMEFWRKTYFKLGMIDINQ